MFHEFERLQADDTRILRGIADFIRLVKAQIT